MISISTVGLDVAARVASADARIAEAEDSARLAEKARRDAFVAIARDIPDPELFAQYLPQRFVLALEASRVGPLGWRVDTEFAPEMRDWGLVEYGGDCLTAYGLAVRRAVLSWGED